MQLEIFCGVCMMCDMHVLGAAHQIVDYKSEVVVTEGTQEEEKGQLKTVRKWGLGNTWLRCMPIITMALTILCLILFYYYLAKYSFR